MVDGRTRHGFGQVLQNWMILISKSSVLIGHKIAIATPNARSWSRNECVLSSQRPPHLVSDVTIYETIVPCH